MQWGKILLKYLDKIDNLQCVQKCSVEKLEPMMRHFSFFSNIPSVVWHLYEHKRQKSRLNLGTKNWVVRSHLETNCVSSAGSRPSLVWYGTGRHDRAFFSNNPSPTLIHNSSGVSSNKSITSLAQPAQIDYATQQKMFQ